jgi:hypothetical protein
VTNDILKQQRAVHSIATRWPDAKLSKPLTSSHPQCELPGCSKLVFVFVRTPKERSNLCYEHYQAVQSAARELTGSKR